tara:strand:+ start:194890 stop:196902 length:2013 start_codon:yes stop_codon:yes gene_type:complete
MQIQSLLLIILAALVALGIVGFQYYNKTKRKGKLTIFLSFLRFIGIFSLLLLLINPKFTKKEYTLEKTNLVILVDNSTSVKVSKSSIDTVLQEIKANSTLNEKFKIQQYNFGEQLKISDSLTFSDERTDVFQALSAVSNIYRNKNTVGVLLTDGNQTIGQDYEFYGTKLKFPIFPIAVGDTTSYEDIRISQVNTNKYAFLKNKFPIEFYVSYDGLNDIISYVTISINGKSVFKEQIQLSAIQKSKRFATFLEANSVGLKKIQITVASIENERNIRNNQRTLAVEVIDEKTNIGIVSAISHPDIGALTKAIESNEQRSVTLLTPNDLSKDLEEIDIFVLYQPNTSFKNVYDYIANKNASVFIIAGTKTDLNFLNRVQTHFKIETGYPIQEVSAVLQTAFSKYDISDFKITEFPPVLSTSGDISFMGTSESLLQMNIKGVDLPNPLLAITETNESKLAIFLGENIWKWRLQAYRNDRNFENFDQFFGKLFLFLSDNKKKNRLNIDYQPIYEGVGNAKITATYFDEAFVFDANASLVVKLNGEKEIPMLLKNKYYEADLSDLNAGTYNFTVAVSKSPLSKSGTLTILDFDVEQQFLATDYKKLNTFAQTTNGKLYYPNEIMPLLEQLNSDNRFLPIQKGTENVVSLIDFKMLLGIIIAALSLEWFIRKFNGLI